MGGGKQYQTTTNLAVADLYKDNNKMYMKEMLRMFALLKRVNARYMGTQINMSANNYYNGAKLQALGGAVENTASVNVASKTALIKWMEGRGTHFTFPVIFVTEDANGVSCTFNAKKLKDTLGQIYTVDNTHSKTFSYTRSFDSDKSKGGAYTKYRKEDSGGTWTSVEKWLDNDKIGTSHDDGGGCTFTPVHIAEDHTFSYTLPAYVINGESYLLKSDVITNDEVTMELVSDPTQTINVHVPRDDRTVYIAKFVTGLQESYYISCGVGYTGWTGYYSLFKSDFLGEYSEARFLMFPLKHNFADVDNEGYRSVLLSSLGLNNGDLQKSLSDSDIKSALVSYVSERDNPLYEGIIKTVYGDSYDNSIVFQSPYFHFEYKSGVDYNDGVVRTVTYDGVSHNITNSTDKAYIIPIDYITDNFGTRQKYDELDNLASLIVAQSKTVKLEWYQTVWIDLISLIFAAVLAPFTAGASFFLYVAGKVVQGLVELGYIDSKTGVVIMVILSLISLYFTGGISGWDIFNSIFNIASAIATEIFITRPMQEIQEEIQEANTEAAKIRDVLESIRENQLYIPFDTYDMPAAALYDLPYNAYSTIQDSLYDYDSKFATTGRIT